MALDPHRDVGPEADAATAPRALRGPTDASPPLEHIGGSEPLRVLQRELSHQWPAHGTPGRTVRFWAGRVTGRSRRRLLRALGAATVALADHCDRVTDRVMAQGEIADDLAATLGEELARLRAEVLHLRELTTTFGHPPDD